MLITEQAYQKSIELLKKNSTNAGFVAASKSEKVLQRGYHAIFGRDAMICALGAISSEDKDLIETAQKSLATLALNANSRGQIPFSVNVSDKFVKFRMPKNVDNTLWWLIVFWILTEELGDKNLKSKFQTNFEKGLEWLHYYLNQGLLEQGEAGDWADEMPRSGLVLYTNALWMIFLNIINSQERKQVYKNFEYFFLNDKPTVSNKILDKNFKSWRQNKKKFMRKQKHFIAAVSRVTVDESFDVFGNILACISDLVPASKQKQIISEIKKVKASHPVPIRVLARPVVKNRQGIFESSHQNKPWHYHNAGAWPFVGGFWVYLLAKNGQNKLAKQELIKLAEANYINDWEFNEYFHGKTGRPQGVKHQSWNAATYILAYNALIHNKFII